MAQMECERVAELLPWLKNGTLAGPEEQLVREHFGHCHECARELAETDFAWSVYQQHVPAKALVSMAYERALPAAQRDLFDRHLAACAACAAELDLVKESRRLEAGEERRDESNVVPFSTGTRVRGKRIPVWQYGAIAAAILLLIASGWWLRSWQQARNPAPTGIAQEKALRERLAALEAENERLRKAETQLNQQQNKSNDEIAQLRSENKEAQARIQQQQAQTRNELAGIDSSSGRERIAPQINVLAVDVYPVGMAQRDAAAIKNEVVIPGNVTAVTLMLHSQAAESQSYRIEILNARGRVIWRAGGLMRNATNDYTISVDAKSLAAGSYTINIYGRGAAGHSKAESYEIVVRRV